MSTYQDSNSPFTYENLIVGSQQPLVNEQATFEAGEVLPRGAMVGRLTSSGLWKEAELSEISSYDQLGVTAETVASDVCNSASVYVRGELNINAVQFYYGDTGAEWQEKCAENGIFLRATIVVDPNAATD